MWDWTETSTSTGGRERSPPTLSDVRENLSVPACKWTGALGVPMIEGIKRDPFSGDQHGSGLELSPALGDAGVNWSFPSTCSWRNKPKSFQRTSEWEWTGALPSNCRCGNGLENLQHRIWEEHRRTGKEPSQRRLDMKINQSLTVPIIVGTDWNQRTGRRSN